MNRICKRVIKAWLHQGYDTKSYSFWTNGERIYSYGTVLLQVINGIPYLNKTFYSTTTRIYQNHLSKIIPARLLTNVPEDTLDLQPYVEDLTLNAKEGENVSVSK